MAFSVQIRGGGFDIKAGTITDVDVSATAAVQESKLLLYKGTQNLYDNSVRIDEDRTIAENVGVTFPKTGRLIKDTEGKTFRETFTNGVQILTEV